MSKLQTVNQRDWGIMKTCLKTQFTAGQKNQPTNQQKHTKKTKASLQRYVTESQYEVQSVDVTKWS